MTLNLVGFWGVVTTVNNVRCPGVNEDQCAWTTGRFSVRGPQTNLAAKTGNAGNVGIGLWETKFCCFDAAVLSNIPLGNFWDPVSLKFSWIDLEPDHGATVDRLEPAEEDVGRTQPPYLLQHHTLPMTKYCGCTAGGASCPDLYWCWLLEIKGMQNILCFIQMLIICLVVYLGKVASQSEDGPHVLTYVCFNCHQKSHAKCQCPLKLHIPTRSQSIWC